MGRKDKTEASHFLSSNDARSCRYGGSGPSADPRRGAGSRDGPAGQLLSTRAPGRHEEGTRTVSSTNGVGQTADPHDENQRWTFIPQRVPNSSQNGRTPRMFPTEGTRLANRDVTRCPASPGRCSQHGGQASPRTCRHGQRHEDERERGWARTQGDKPRAAQTGLQTGAAPAGTPGGCPPTFKRKLATRFLGSCPKATQQES